jgi:chemotaxis protein CheD
VYVYPGRVVASGSGHRLRTVLGSCVSVCLYDPGLRAGGMNHYLLPDAAGSEGGSPRFGGPAIQRLIGQHLGLGADPGRLVAKLFGGSGSDDAFANGFHVVWRNVQVARRVLQDEQIPIIGEDVGGRRGRRLFFDTARGSALVSLI